MKRAYRTSGLDQLGPVHATASKRWTLSPWPMTTSRFIHALEARSATARTHSRKPPRVPSLPIITMPYAPEEP